MGCEVRGARCGLRGAGCGFMGHGYGAQSRADRAWFVQIDSSKLKAESSKYVNNVDLKGAGVRP
jgi:hypothetical protein